MNTDLKEESEKPANIMSMMMSHQFNNFKGNTQGVGLHSFLFPVIKNNLNGPLTLFFHFLTLM